MAAFLELDGTDAPRCLEVRNLPIGLVFTERLTHDDELALRVAL